ncbi:LCP family protein [Pseudolysinimonas sp.]|uniref:LCP family protein n=1 Tax=Pseudolysinimonas sp. TaxID=2680009 RepID=UPI003F7D5744
MSQLRDRSKRAPRAATIARHGRGAGSAVWKTVLGLLGAVVVVALVAGGSLAAIATWNLTKDVKHATIAADTQGPPPNIAAMKGGFNILLVGTDTRVGQGSLGGGVRTAGTGALNDVNILIHVAADQKSAVAVSIPRDMVVPIPKCEKGGPASGLPINNALSLGGLACVAATVQSLTGLNVDFAGLITFEGVIAMSDAVGGVDVCTNGPIRDKDSGLDIESAGTHTLQGAQALAFLRTRHGVGDGSDLGRINSQQVYLSSLVRKIKSSGTLTDVSKVYGIARAATENITLSDNFSRLDTLVSIALVLKNIPLQNIVFVQYPGTTGGTGIYAGKVQPSRALATELFTAIKADKPIGLDANSVGGDTAGSTLDPNAPKPTSSSTPAPGASDSAGDGSQTIAGLKGQTAAQYTCSVAYHF